MELTLQAKKGWTLVVFLTLLTSVLFAFTSKQKPDPVKTQLLREGLNYCRRHDTSPIKEIPEYRTENPRFDLFTTEQEDYTVIKGATIIDGDGSISNASDIYIKNGIVVQINPTGLADYFNGRKANILDAAGHYVSPGLVEMHSHVGICSQPELRGVNDMFELMSPATPFTRIIDAFNVGDPSIQMSASGGVTSALILPSANLISGEGFVMKMALPDSLSAEEMLVQYSPNQAFEDLERQRWMKMACGENPKKRYVSRPEAPKSRMGLGHLFRQTMQKAQKLKAEQDFWCDNAGRALPETPYPVDDELDLLVDLLRGKVKTNVHCYETFDIETILRHAREFGIEINALHHSLDAYRIPKIIQEQPYDIVLATFASQWGFKKEAFQASLFGPKIMEQNNMTVILTTDHPALPGQSLIYQAQMAHHYGLSTNKAFASVTGEPAKALQLDDRIGFLRKGYDADLIIWNQHPLQMGAKPLKVFIDGHPVIDNPLIGAKLDPAPSSVPDLDIKQIDLRKFEGADSFLIKGIKFSLIEKFATTADTTYQLLVKDGKVECFAETCTADVPTIKFNDGFISPMLTALTPGHGLLEMASEPMTGDGILVKASEEGLLPEGTILYAKHGLHLGSSHLERAVNMGVGRIVSPPFRGEGNLFVTGVSVAFWADGDDLSSIIKDDVALHITVGDSGKQKGVPTISAQIATLRDLLVDSDGVYGRVARGELPLAVHTNNKDVMLHIIKLKQDFGINVIIIGGIEAHLIATKLSENEIPVVVTPWFCQRRFWEERRCLTGLDGQSTVLKVLHDAGVKVAIGTDDDIKVRMLLPDSGLAAALSEIAYEDVVKMLTTNVDEIFDLPSGDAFFISEGHPLAYGSYIGAIIKDNKLKSIFPEIEPTTNHFIE